MIDRVAEPAARYCKGFASDVFRSHVDVLNFETLRDKIGSRRHELESFGSAEVSVSLVVHHVGLANLFKPRWEKDGELAAARLGRCESWRDFKCDFDSGVAVSKNVRRRADLYIFVRSDLRVKFQRTGSLDCLAIAYAVWATVRINAH